MTTKFFWIVPVASALLLLSACGGGGGGGAEPVAVEETTVPDSALASNEQFSRWVGARESSESRDPLAMNSMLPPTSDTAEPIEVD